MKKVIHTIGVGSMFRKEIVMPPAAPRRSMVSRLRRVEDFYTEYFTDSDTIVFLKLILWDYILLMIFSH